MTRDTYLLPITRYTPLLLLLALAGLLFFLNLGTLGLTDRDEGRNAEAGREMLETGDWISPTFNYEPRYAKPVFLYWLMSGSYRLLGVSEFAARFPSALFGLALIGMQYLVLTRVRGPAVGLFGSLMLLLNVEMLSLCRMALTDSVLIFFTTLSLFGFWLGFSDEERSRHWLWAFYGGMALGTLTKGPVGLLVPLLTVLCYLALTKRWRQFWTTGFPLAGTALFLILALPWYIAMMLIHGADYSASAQANTVGRFLNPMEGHSFSFLFYLPVLFLGFFPWSGWLPAALYQTWKSWREARGARLEANGEKPPAPQELEWFAAIWVAVVFVFFTLSSTRLPHYIGPLFPAAALLTASYWSRGLLDQRTPGLRLSIHVMMGLGYLLALAIAALPSFYSSYAAKLVREFPLATQVDLGSGPYMAAMVLLIGMALVGYFGLSEERRTGAFWAAGATLACLVLILLVVMLPRYNRYVIAPPQELAYAAGLNLNPTDRLIVYGTTRPSSVFYAKRKIIFVPSGEEANILSHLRQPGRTMILLPASLRSRLPQDTTDFPVILQRFGYILLADKPIIEIPAGQGPPSSPPVLIPGLHRAPLCRAGCASTGIVPAIPPATVSE